MASGSSTIDEGIPQVEGGERRRLEGSQNESSGSLNEGQTALPFKIQSAGREFGGDMAFTGIQGESPSQGRDESRYGDSGRESADDRMFVEENDTPQPSANEESGLERMDMDMEWNFSDLDEEGNIKRCAGETQEQRSPSVSRETRRTTVEDAMDVDADGRSSIPQGAAGPKVPNSEKKKKKCKKNTRASIKIAALNIAGNGNVNAWHPDNKWNHVNQVMKDKRIGILLVSEAHLDDQRRDNVESLFGKRLRVVHSMGPAGPNSMGVAVVLNKELTNVDNLRTWVIVPGRALLLETLWHGNEKLSVLVVYAPNNPAENAEFWKVIRKFFEDNPRIRRPDLVAGDFNMVEDAVDRLPAKADRAKAAVEELDDLKTELQLVDGWRETFPSTLAFTHMQKPQMSQARLDRIYVKSRVMKNCYEWKIEPAGIDTDHSMVSVRFSSEAAPEVGHGRWVWPMHIMKDPELKKYIEERGIKLEQELLDPMVNTVKGRVQSLWEKFKVDITARARERAKIVIPKLVKSIRELEVRLESVLNDAGISEEERQLSAAVLTEALTNLEMKRHKLTRDQARARNALQGEIISKYWTNLNKVKKPREAILRLRLPNQDEAAENLVYEKNPQRMANIARDHHDNVQNEREPRDPRTREEQTKYVLKMINRKISEDEFQDMSNILSEEAVEEALKLSANGKAPGLDGIPYELYKILRDRYKEQKRKNVEGFDIIWCLQRVFNEVEENGLEEGAKFAESWMSPMYKKGDRADIVNYRPISLLNTDYKVMTKALTLKLAKAAPGIIHENQAGFVPGRQIYDQIWLTKRVIELAEAIEQNGVIVCLDQEKAYDKIEHDYLWKVLDQFGIPPLFIGTVKALYAHADTWVMINGKKSDTPFRVSRGVRQGDPLSCLLFDLAIEPLAEMLRQSELEGFRIPGAIERLITSLFADDTTVYLSEDDDYAELMSILNRYCTISGAKFNIAKNEVIPIGNPVYREAVVRTRCINGVDGTPIPDGIRILKDGEAARTLGTMVGNGICVYEPWARVLEKIDSTLAVWEKGHPTMEGRRLIAQMMIGGISQYPAKVQGMPKDVEDRMEKRVRKFLWAEKSNPTVNKETIYAPLEAGGRKLLDIKARNEAINIMWLKSYLNFGPKRPLWAYAADALMAHYIRAEDSSLEANDLQSPFLQSWKTCPTQLPKDLQAMFGVAAKYNVRIDALAPSRDIAREMPIWYHVKSRGPKSLFSAGGSKCLKENHGIETVGDAETFVGLTNPANHRRTKKCKCNVCTRIRAETECTNPSRCFERMREVLNSLPPKWNPLTKVLPEDSDAQFEEHVPDPEVEGIVRKFDSRTTLTGELADTFRIFPKKVLNDSLKEKPPKRRMDIVEVVVYTDGSAKDVNKKSARAGAGVYFGKGDKRNKAIRVPESMKQTNQVAELLGTKEALDAVPLDVDMRIKTDSMYVIDLPTKGLRKIEDEGFRNVANARLVELVVSKLRQRSGETYFEWVKGHSGVEGNEEADKLASKAAEKQPQRLTKNRVPAGTTSDGMMLSKMTQSKAYRAVREIKMNTEKYKEALERTSTVRNVKNAIACGADEEDDEPTDDIIWKSLRSKDFSRSARYFLWMTMHEGYKVGKYWLMTQNNQDRAMCEKCGVVESMEHILFDCEFPGQKEIWEIAAEVWKSKTGEELNMTFGGMLACGAYKVVVDGEVKKGQSRLRRILISELAHLIWKIRNARVCDGGTPATIPEVRNRCICALNARLQLDMMMSDKRRYGSKAIKKALVLKTWSGTLKDEDKLPEDWIREKGVLVGVT